jgi:hypothetical protein
MTTTTEAALRRMEDDLRRLTEAVDALATIAEAVEASREALVRVRDLAADMHDSSLRRLVLSAASQVKADAGSLLPPRSEPTPRSRGRRKA